MLYPSKIMLPGQGTDFEKWAALACDQFTSQPEYWKSAEEFVGDAPSALRIVLPEVYLESDDVEQRISAIKDTMNRYLADVLTREIDGYVYVERDTGRGDVRCGLVGAVDLEQYSFEKGAKPLIRPSENTVVERIPPRLAVRRGAPLESPHIMMLVDDDACGIIERFSSLTAQMECVYDTPLMLGGGRVRGWAVTSRRDIEFIKNKTEEIASQEYFDAKYPEAAGSAPIEFAVGDGNHSLATAKAYWEELKATLSEEERQNHPARYCLVELVNIHSAAIGVEGIHRVLFGAQKEGFISDATEFFTEAGCTVGETGEQQMEIYLGQERVQFALTGSPWPLAVGSIEAFISWYMEKHSDVRVDYIHGADTTRNLAQAGNIGIVLPDFEKSDLFRGVVLGGVLPRKTFSMGHAEEKRYYLECRRIAR